MSKEPPSIKPVQQPPSNTHPKRKRGRHADAVSFPAHTVNEAVKVAKALWELNSGQPSAIMDLAQHMEYKPTSPKFQALLSSAYKYGLVTHSWAQDANRTTAVSPLGQSIVVPREPAEVGVGLVGAFLKPEIFANFLHSTDGKPVLDVGIYKNKLMREHHVPEGSADSCCEVIMKNLEELDLTERREGKQYIRLDKNPAPDTASQLVGEKEPDAPVQMEAKRIFVAHGRNHVPLEQLKTILDEFGIKYVIAEEEAEVAVPISEKVATAMDKCSLGMFIFTADETLTKEDGTTVVWPNSNVLYELGVGFVKYKNKIVILMEEGVNFPSDISGLTHITFAKDSLDAETLQLIKVLTATEFLKLSPG